MYVNHVRYFYRLARCLSFAIFQSGTSQRKCISDTRVCARLSLLSYCCMSWINYCMRRGDSRRTFPSSSVVKASQILGILWNTQRHARWKMKGARWSIMRRNTFDVTYARNMWCMQMHTISSDHLRLRLPILSYQHWKLRLKIGIWPIRMKQILRLKIAT